MQKHWNLHRGDRLSKSYIHTLQTSIFIHISEFILVISRFKKKSTIFTRAQKVKSGVITNTI